MKARVVRVGYCRGAEIQYFYPKDITVDVGGSGDKFVPAELLVEFKKVSPFSFYRKKKKIIP